MGFKNLINSRALLNTFEGIISVKNSKKIAALVALFLLGSTQVLMAQTDASGTATAPTEEQTSAMWAGVEYYVLLFILLCVAVAIIGRIFKIADLTSQLQGKKPTNWNSVMGVLFAIFLVVGMYGAFWSFIVQGNMSLPEPASIHGKWTDNMFYVTFGITVVVFIITQILLFTFAYFYRQREGRKAYFYPHNNTIEKIWTVVPAIVLTVLVVFGFFTWRTITNSTEVKGDINIEVTGHQFAWELRYPGADNKLGRKYYKLTTTANSLGIDYKDKNSFDDLKADTLVIPVGKSIRLNITAMDVIHSVYMPHFRLQLNAVPGLPTYFRFVPTLTTDQMRAKLADPTFEYKLYCAKICGDGHYNMQRVVRVVSASEYNVWVAHQQPYLTDGVKKELNMATTEPVAEPAAKDSVAHTL